MTRFSSFFPSDLPRPVFLLLGIWALFIQTQINFGRSETSLGLTINLGDFLLPFVGGTILWSLIRGTSRWPRWAGHLTDFFMAGLTGLCLFSLLWGAHLTGAFSSWALINRFIGWGVLVAYFYAGGWLVSTYGAQAGTRFVTLLFAATTLICAITLLSCFLWDINIRPFPAMPTYPLAGLMWNRNAFAFLYMASVTGGIILAMTDPASLGKMQRLLLILMMVTLPLALFYNGSRVLIYIMPALLLGLLLIWRGKFIRLLALPLLAGLILPILAEQVAHQPLLRERQAERMTQIITQETPAGHYIHASDNTRALVYSDAFHWWQEHPVLGLGLGGFLERQKAVHGKLIDLVDSVPLWLLSEMGVVGAFLFAGFGAYLTQPLVGRLLVEKTPKLNNARRFSMVALATLVIFVVMGTIHQIFYARFLWLLLGMAAALPRAATTSQPDGKPLT